MQCIKWQIKTELLSKTKILLKIVILFDFIVIFIWNKEDYKRLSIVWSLKGFKMSQKFGVILRGFPSCEICLDLVELYLVLNSIWMSWNLLQISKKMVLGSRKSPLDTWPPKHRFRSRWTLSDNILRSKIRLVVEKLFMFFVTPSRSHP